MATNDRRVGKTGNVTWSVRVQAHGRTRLATFKRKSDACARASNIEADLSRGLHVPEKVESRRSVADMSDRYLLEHLPNKPKREEQKNSQRYLQGWKSQSGDTSLPRLTPDSIASTRNVLLGGKLTPTTRRGWSHERQKHQNS